MMSKHGNDPVGKALLDYLQGKREEQINVLSPDVEEDVIPVHYMFRSFDDMPEVEQKALRLCRGEVLDVGAGAGCHSLWLQEQGMTVTALEQSTGSVEAMQKQGLKDVRQGNIWEWQEGQYDTVLLMMNGIGMAGKLEHVPEFLRKLKSLLKPGGQILFDSTDLIYLFLDDEGGAWIDLNDKYIGEVEYEMEYEGIRSGSFPWLFLDYDLLDEAAEMTGLQAEKVLSTDLYGYLACLTMK